MLTGTPPTLLRESAVNLPLLAQEPPLPTPGFFLPQLLSFGSYLYIPFLLWMAYVCIRDDPDSRIWLWVIFLLQPFGPFVYLIARYLPTRDWQGPKWLRRWTRGNEIRRKEIAAHNIGNAHQYIELGDARREIGQWTTACESYGQALAKEPDNIAALWGAGQCEFQAKHFAEARTHLEAILKKDPAYKFGDVSLLQGKVLQALGEEQAAIAHFREHTRRWRHPESLYVLGELLAGQNEPAEARRILEGLVMDLEAAPKAIARKQMFWKGRAKRLMRTLPR